VIKSRYHPITRSSELCTRTDLGVDGDKLIAKARESIDEGRWVAIHFDGIGGEWLSIDAEDFIRLLDYLRDHKDKIWRASWGAAYHLCQRERPCPHRSAGNVGSPDTNPFDNRLESGVLCRTAHADNPSARRLVGDSGQTKNGQSKPFHARNGTLQYEVVPDRGEIELQPDR